MEKQKIKKKEKLKGNIENYEKHCRRKENFK